MSTMPPALATLADLYYKRQQNTTRLTMNQLQRLWKTMLKQQTLRDKWDWHEENLPKMVSLIQAGQIANAERSAEYLALTAAVQQIDASEVALITENFASPPEVIEKKMTSPMARFSVLALAGAPDVKALPLTMFDVVTYGATLVQDAGREATGVGIAAHTGFVGYYRKLTLPSCKRCAILAGKFFNDNEGFLRHPRCDCVHVPAADRYDDGEQDIDAAIKRGKVTGFSKADLQAIEDGADPITVVNIRRKGSVSTADMFGKTVETTSVSTGKRSAWWWLPPGQKRPEFRLTPTSILKIAGDDKEQRVALLRLHGYIR